MSTQAPATKDEAARLFHKWNNQRPRLDPRDYSTRKQLTNAYRRISRQGSRASYAIRLFEYGPYYPDLLADAFKRAFSGRLKYVDGHLEYCTGQYWPTEYRLALAVVLDYYNTAAYARWAAEETTR